MFAKLVIRFSLLFLCFGSLTSSDCSFTCVKDGSYAYNGCTQYHVCVYTNTVYAYQVLYNCLPGLLFDENLQACNYADQVICGSSSTQTTSSISTTTTKQSSKITTILSTTAMPTTTATGKVTTPALTTTSKFENNKNIIKNVKINFIAYRKTTHFVPRALVTSILNQCA